MNYWSDTPLKVLRRHLQQINAACKWALQEGKIAANPFADLPAIRVKRKKPGYREKAFTAAERDLIIEAFYSNRFCPRTANVKHSFYADAIAWGFNTGLRSEELWALKFKHVRGNRIQIMEARPHNAKLAEAKNTKTKQPRDLPLNEELQEILVTRRERLGGNFDSLLFPGVRGGYVDYGNFAGRQWKKVVDSLVEAGEIRRYLRPYAMRHTFASLAIAREFPLPK